MAHKSNIESIIKARSNTANVYDIMWHWQPDGNIKHLNMKGYLYDIHHNQKSHKKENTNKSGFETIFMADHGSAKRYIEQEGVYQLNYWNRI